MVPTLRRSPADAISAKPVVQDTGEGIPPEQVERILALEHLLHQVRDDVAHGELDVARQHLDVVAQSGQPRITVSTTAGA